MIIYSITDLNKSSIRGNSTYILIEIRVFSFIFDPTFQLLLSKFRLFNFDLMYFLCSFVVQYLIGKLSDMIKVTQEGLVVAALLASVRTSWKVTNYYINSALLILNHKPLNILDLHVESKSESLVLNCF